MPDGITIVHRPPMILLAAKDIVTAVYWNSVYARDGGLLSHGPDNVDIFSRAAAYVDRILRGAAPADLPVPSPVKFEIALNAKTAKALGLEVPPSIMLRADQANAKEITLTSAIRFR